jgi:hypothetical protein
MRRFGGFSGRFVSRPGSAVPAPRNIARVARSRALGSDSDASVPTTGASSPRVPGAVSSPGFSRDSRSCLSDAQPPLDTMVTSPLLQSPLGAPFGPSSWGVAARPIRCPAFRPRGASLASPASGLLCPLLTSPSRSGSVARPPVLSDSREISQGKTQNVLRADAGFIKHTPLRMEDFAVTCPLVPGVPHLRSGSCSSPRALGLGFLQTHLAMTSLPFSLPSAPR